MRLFTNPESQNSNAYALSRIGTLAKEGGHPVAVAQYTYTHKQYTE